MPKKKIPSDRLVDILEGQEMRVKYRDILDLKQFYKDLRDWLLEHHWEANDPGSTFWETFYGERITMQGVKEIWVQWRIAKGASASTQAYQMVGPFVFYIDMDWHLVGLTKVDVMKDGHKLKMDKGEVEIKFKAFLEKVYEEHVFAHSPLLKPFKEIFSERIYKDEVEKREKELYQELYELQNFIKQWFKMKRHLPYEETRLFFKSRAWPSHVKEG